MYFEYTEDEVMRPLDPKRAARQYAIGAHYRLEVREERSEASHRGYMATVTEAYENLPEHLAERFKSADHLRKFCLIRAGYRTERSIACTSADEAKRFAAFVGPMDDFAVVLVDGSLVTVFTAESQSYGSQGKKRFQESQQAVRDELAKLIGTSTETLEDNVGRAA
jgi:hypothetical protein